MLTCSGFLNNCANGYYFILFCLFYYKESDYKFIVDILVNAVSILYTCMLFAVKTMPMSDPIQVRRYERLVENVCDLRVILGQINNINDNDDDSVSENHEEEECHVDYKVIVKYIVSPAKDVFNHILRQAERTGDSRLTDRITRMINYFDAALSRIGAQPERLDDNLHTSMNERIMMMSVLIATGDVFNYAHYSSVAGTSRNPYEILDIA